MSICKYYPRHPKWTQFYPADEVRYYSDAYESGCSTIIVSHGISDCVLMIPNTYSDDDGANLKPNAA